MRSPAGRRHLEEEISSFERMFEGIALVLNPTLLTVAAALGTSALAASYFPARRAASVNPVDALRSD